MIAFSFTPNTKLKTMSKKEQILTHYEAWTKGETPKRIASLVGTTRQYVMQVMNYNELEVNAKNRESVFYPDLTEKDAEDYAYVEPEIIEYKEITLFPKVNKLTDGRIELIYESKMNYES